MHQDELFVGGAWTAATTGERIDVVSPVTETLVARVAAAAPDDVDRAVEAARNAFDTGPWPRLKPARSVSTRVTPWTRSPAFGGAKASGYGRELGHEGIDGYVDTKSIAVARKKEAR